MAVVLIHLQSVDFPVGIRKCLWVVPNILDACRCLLRAGARVPNALAASPLTTKGRVKYNLLLLKSLRNVAATNELGSWLAPTTGVRAVTQYVLRNRIAGEVEDTNRICCPLCSVHASSDRVEAGAVALCRGVLDGTPRICRLAIGSDIAVACVKGTRELSGVLSNPATWSSVQCHAVVRLFVHAFENVNLTVVRPVWPDCPEAIHGLGTCLCLIRLYSRRPSTTSKRHMGNIKNDQTTVVALLARNPNARSTMGCLVPSIDPPLYGRGRIVVDEVGLSRGCFVDIIHKALQQSVQLGLCNRPDTYPR